VPRFRALDVVANCQAYWAQHDAQMDELTTPFLGQDRVDLMYPFGELHRAGTVLAMGSDWGVSTADPLAQIEVAVRRTDPADRDADPFLPHQALTVADALGAFTAGSAYVNHDDDAGTLEVGRRADLVVLDRDVLAHGAGPVGDARVRLTVASGGGARDRVRRRGSRPVRPRD
jgi:predicted amidohydrolase YtcJ